MAAYYNEIDSFAAQWLRNLIAAGHIAPGDVDDRSIEDVQPDDVRPYTQAHFFAGLGVWSYAFRLAGWHDDEPVWTGSCPCQPFSAAGKGAGFDDERHLWPAWFHLIRECRPAVIFGEQVASKDAEPWLDLVSTDLEALGYAFGATAFPSAGVGAPHIRDRTYFVAHADDTRSQGRKRVRERAAERAARSSGVAGIVADTNGREFDGLAVVRGVERDGADAGRPQGRGEPQSHGDVRGLADAYRARTNSEPGNNDKASRLPQNERESKHGPDVLERSCGDCDRLDAVCGDGLFSNRGRPGPTNGFWANPDWLLCRDGKWRPVESGTFPLAYGAPARVGRLRAYGNAINAEAARVFIECAMECMPY